MRFLLTAARRLHQAAWLAAGLIVGGWAQAENIATVHTAALPSLTTTARVEAFLTLSGQPLVLAGDTAWQLKADASAWTTLPWQAGPPVIGSADGGIEEAAFLLRSGDDTQAFTRLDRLSLQAGQLKSEQLAMPPIALSKPQAAMLTDALYLAGQASDGSARLLQLKPANASGLWSELKPWSGGGSPSSMVTQTAALFLTVSDGAGKPERRLRWSPAKGWTVSPSAPGPVLAASARALGQAHVLYLLDVAGAAQLQTFQTITGSWATLFTTPVGDVRLSTAWRNGIAWLRTGSDPLHNDFAVAEVESGKQLLKWLDWVVIVVYLSSMLGIGLYFYRREKRNSTSDFFVGGRSIPFWAAGVSLYAANTSSISYIAIPAKAFETNWQYLTNNLIAVVGLMFVAVWIVPLLRRLNLMSVFSYLETRFHPAIRMLASGLCILVQIGSRMSVVLYLPSLAIATITGIDVVWSVLMMGGFTIAYTALGGMKAVVWTDVVQLVVKMGGAIFAIGFMIYALKGGFSEFWSVALAEDKTKMFDFSFDLTKATVWGFIFLVLFDVVLTFPKDQVLMQRTLSTKNDRDAGRSIWAFALIMIPGGFVFYTIGTALFVFYKANPERMNPLLSIDATFPMFIAAELPMGITGLIIAGIFAAAMATLSSIMNSVATLASVDFYEQLVKNRDQKKSVLFAEIMTVVAGLLGIATALALSRFDIHSLFDVSIELAGLLGGGFAGAYTLGMFTRRANTPGVAIGVAAAIVLTTIAWTMSLVHPYFYLAISIMLCIVIGYVASLFFPAPTRSLKGLTIYADV